MSNGAMRKIAARFPGLSIVAIERAAASFLMELRAPRIEPRLSEARDELNIFAKEIARFHGALNQIRQHRLDRALGEASRIISGENEFEDVEHSLSNLRTAVQQTSRTLPSNSPALASRRLIATLARQVEEAKLPLSGAASDSLVGLIHLIFDDLMVGGDAASAVSEWRRSQATDIDQERANMLLDLVP